MENMLVVQHIPLFIMGFEAGDSLINMCGKKQGKGHSQLLFADFSIPYLQKFMRLPLNVHHIGRDIWIEVSHEKFWTKNISFLGLYWAAKYDHSLDSVRKKQVSFNNTNIFDLIWICLSFKHVHRQTEHIVEMNSTENFEHYVVIRIM